MKATNTQTGVVLELSDDEARYVLAALPETLMTLALNQIIDGPTGSAITIPTSLKASDVDKNCDNPNCPNYSWRA